MVMIPVTQKNKISNKYILFHSGQNVAVKRVIDIDM